MESLILYIFVAVAGFFVGYTYSQYRNLKRSIETLRSLKAKLDEIENNSQQNVTTVGGILLKHEIVNNVHYFYRDSDDSFVCQGSTLEEAATRYNERQQKLSACFVHSVDGQTYCFLDGKLLTNDSFDIIKL